MNWIILLKLAAVHYIADFWVQTHKQSQDKSSSLLALSNHVSTYSFSFMILSFGLFDDLGIILSIFGITFITHWVTDYVTSRIAKYYFGKGDIRKGFQVVGLDQLIHMITLYTTFNYFM